MDTTFTPASALAGGLMIGGAVIVLFISLGRIAGVSGMVASALRPSTPRAERLWRAAFLAGLVIGPVLASFALGRPLVRPSPTAPAPLVVAGLLVGLGTAMAGGCTSGHGVCGLSRLSARSIVATLIFMLFGFATASFLRHGFG